MDKSPVKNYLYAIELRKGYGPTEATFSRRNRGSYTYLPTTTSLERLEEHFPNPVIIFGQGFIVLIQYL